MKTIVKRLARDEKGASLVMVLILLLISGLIIGPLLSYMGTGLITGEVYETRTNELYAADAGVEDAIWKIQNNEGNLPCSPGHSWSYNIADVNGKSLQISIEYLDGGTYRITSTAVTDDGSGTAAITGTAIEAYVTDVTGNYSGLLDNIITSQNATDIHTNVILDYTEGHGPEEYYDGPWPTPDNLADWYWEDVKGETPYPYSTIDLEGEDDWIGPLYRDGELDILNSIKTDPPATLSLDGTLYITGDTLIGGTKHDFTLDLNGHTIFVTSDTTGPPYAIWIGDKCTIEGPGVIIAVGDIYFEPKAQTGGEENPIFIFSVEGETQIQPSGLFYGAIAGSVEVDIRPGHNPNIIYPLGGFGGYNLNFPGFDVAKSVSYSIASWEVIPLWRE